MKIPQRQDQVSLTSPQVATGQAVEPVAEAMGSSYLNTMKSMNKTFQELSDLSYKLYENKMEGQQDKLKLYANQRTKQYEQEISMATNQEEIDKLFFQYKKDIDTAGNELLGAERYNSWYSKEGGATVAGAEYAGNVASAQLQINLNKQTLEDAGRQYNELAFTARNPEERNKYIKEWEDMLNRYVANGTISQAEKQDTQRDWNLSFTKSLVTQEVDINPEKALKNLRENKDYAPMLIGAERLQYIAEAERLIATRAGTQSSSNVKNLKSFWIELNKSNNQGSFDLSMKLFSEAKEDFGKFRKSVKDLFAAIKKENPSFEGFDIDSVSGVDIEEFARWAETTVKNDNQEKVFQFWESRSSLDQDFNSKISYVEKGKRKTIDITSTNRYNYDNNPNKLVELYRQNVKQKDNIQFSTIINSTDSLRNKVNSQQNILSAIYVEGLNQDQRGSTVWENNMYNTLKPFFESFKKENTGDADIKMQRVVEYLWNHYEPSDIFSKEENITQNLIGEALASSGIQLTGKTGKVFMDMFHNKKGGISFVVPEKSFIDIMQEASKDYYGGPL